MYTVAVVLLVGAEGVGDIEVVDGVDGKVYQGLADAVGPEHLADDVFAWEGEHRVAQLEGVAVADDGVEGVVLDAGRGDGSVATRLRFWKRSLTRQPMVSMAW